MMSRRQRLLLHSCSWPSETSRLTTGELLLKCINVIKKEAWAASACVYIPI